VCLYMCVCVSVCVSVRCVCVCICVSVCLCEHSVESFLSFDLWHLLRTTCTSGPCFKSPGQIHNYLLTSVTGLSVSGGWF